MFDKNKNKALNNCKYFKNMFMANDTLLYHPFISCLKVIK